MSTIEESIQALETFGRYHLAHCGSQAVVGLQGNIVMVCCGACEALMELTLHNFCEHELATLKRGLQLMGTDGPPH